MEPQTLLSSSEGGLHGELTRKIIGAAFRVHRELRAGFKEKCYENALMIELADHGLRAVQQAPMRVHYRGQVVGDFDCDILLEDLVMIELKAVEALAQAHEVPLINYLRATPVEIGLLLNFGHKLEIRRKILTNDRK